MILFARWPNDEKHKSVPWFNQNGKPNSSYEEGKKDLNTNKEYIYFEITARENSYFKNIKNNVEGEINYSKLKTGEEVIVASPKSLNLQVLQTAMKVKLPQMLTKK